MAFCGCCRTLDRSSLPLGGRAKGDRDSTTQGDKSGPRGLSFCPSYPIRFAALHRGIEKSESGDRGELCPHVNELFLNCSGTAANLAEPCPKRKMGVRCELLHVPERIRTGELHPSEFGKAVHFPSLRPDGAGGRTDAIPSELHRIRTNCRSSGEKPGHSGAKAEIIIREIIFRSSRSDPSGQVTGLYLREKPVHVRTGGTMTIYFEILAAYSSAAVA